MDRAPNVWHPKHLLTWAALGALVCQLDHLHACMGVTQYPNQLWIGERLPVSPTYVFGSVAAYCLHRLVVPSASTEAARTDGAAPGWRWGARAFGEFAAAYALTAVLGSRAFDSVGGAWICSVALAAWAAYRLVGAWSRHAFRFALLVALLGPAFEWTAVRLGAFVYGVCPAAWCLGAPVPLAWLPLLYLHAAIAVDRLLRPDAWLRAWRIP